MIYENTFNTLALLNCTTNLNQCTAKKIKILKKIVPSFSLSLPHISRKTVHPLPLPRRPNNRHHSPHSPSLLLSFRFFFLPLSLSLTKQNGSGQNYMEVGVDRWWVGHVCFFLFSFNNLKLYNLIREG